MLRPLRPYRQYFNSLVILLTISLSCSDVVSGINTAYSDEKLSEGAKDFRAFLSLIAALALSAFIFKGLGNINKDSQALHNNLSIYKEGDPLARAEEEYGFTASSITLAKIGRYSSAMSIAVNSSATALNFAYNRTLNLRLMDSRWLLFVLALTGFSNLSGFILFNILGTRNAQISKKLDEEKRDAEAIAKDKELEDLKKEITQLKTPKDIPSPAGSGLSSPETNPSATVFTTPTVNSPLTSNQPSFRTP